jgi:hypothetical protein
MNVICESGGTPIIGPLLSRAQAAWTPLSAGRRVVVLLSIDQGHEAMAGHALTEICAWLQSTASCGKVEVLSLAGPCPDPLPAGAKQRHLEWNLGIGVFSSILRDRLPIPDLFLEPVSLITLASASLCGTHAVRGPLLAKAALLEPARSAPRGSEELELACEANRLAESNLCLALVSTEEFTDDPARCCWLAASSDITMELALLRAAGRAEADSPILRLLGQAHAPDLQPLEVEGDLPNLGVFRRSPPLVDLSAAMGRATRAGRRLLEDAQLVRANMHRVRTFAAKRLKFFGRNNAQ